VDLDDLRELEAELLAHDSASRMTMPGVDARRADLLPAGIVTLVAIMELAGVDRLTGSDWALREGMVLEAAGAPATRRATYDTVPSSNCAAVPVVRSALAEGVPTGAGALRRHRGTPRPRGRGPRAFGAGGTAPRHRRPREHRKPRAAQRVPDPARPLRGFSPEEVDVLSCLARFHRRGAPKASFEPWVSLSPERRERTTVLIALPPSGRCSRPWAWGSGTGRDRALDGWPSDRGRSGRDGDIALERYTLRKKGELLERVFGCRIELVESTELATFPAAAGHPTRRIAASGASRRAGSCPARR